MLTKHAFRLSQPLTRSNLLATTQKSRALSSTSTLRAASQSHQDDQHVAAHGGGHDGGGHGHESHYDPPGGWLWGIRPGEKAEREGWEIPFFFGYFPCIILAGIAYSMKEDTSIQTWALEEAQRRLEKEGILEDKSGHP